jgi:hypothetical protein
MMWGANVKTPVDMPDDILKDSIMKTKELIAGCAHIDADGMITRHDITMFSPCILIPIVFPFLANSAIKSIKDHMDTFWEPNW